MSFGMPAVVAVSVIALAALTWPTGHNDNQVARAVQDCKDVLTSAARVACLKEATRSIEENTLPDAGDPNDLGRIRNASAIRRDSAIHRPQFASVTTPAPNVALAAQLVRRDRRLVSFNESPRSLLMTTAYVPGVKEPVATYAMARLPSLWPGDPPKADHKAVPDEGASPEPPTPRTASAASSQEGPPIPANLTERDNAAGAAGDSYNPYADGATQVPEPNPDPDKLGPINSVAPAQRVGATGAVVLPLPDPAMTTPAVAPPVLLPAYPTTGAVPMSRPPLKDLDPDMRPLPSISESRRRTMAPVIRRASAYQMAINAALSKACGPGILSPENSFVSTIAAQIYQESNFNPKATSVVGAQGMTQMMPDTAKGLAEQYPGLRPPRPWDPYWSIEAQAHLMCDNYRLYKPGRSPCSAGLFALSAYNGGPRALGREIALCRGDMPEWLASPALKQTRPITDDSCVTTRWFGHVGDMRSRSVAAYKENRDYGDRILGHQIYFMEAGWGGGWCYAQ